MTQYEVTGVRFYGPDARDRRRKERDERLFRRAQRLAADLRQDPIGTAQTLGDVKIVWTAIGALGGLAGGVPGTLLVVWLVR